MLLETVNLYPPDGRIGMNRVDIAAKYANADAGFVELLTDIGGQAGAELAGRQVDILNGFGQGELYEVNIVGLQRSGQFSKRQAARCMCQGSVTNE